MEICRMWCRSLTVLLAGCAVAVSAAPGQGAENVGNMPPPMMPPGGMMQSGGMMSRAMPPRQTPPMMGQRGMAMGSAMACPMMSGHAAMAGMTGGKSMMNPQLMPMAMMSEDDLAKFADLHEKLGYALEDFRKDASPQNKAALKTALTNLFAAKQAFDLDRAEKALARAKAKVAERDAMVERMFNRMVEKAEKRECDPPGKPGKPTVCPIAIPAPQQ